MKRVTVVIPFYNDPYIGEAIDSVLAQSYGEVEIIVVDDGSTREAERLVPYRGRIHVLGKANGGTASALNHGIRYASGEYVAWLSSDDRFMKEKVGKQLASMEATGAWISHTAFRMIDERGEANGKPVYLAFESMYRFYESFLKGNAVNGCTVMLRKELFDRLGGFDESLPYTHDYDFWLRSILAGYPLAYLDEPLTEYRRHRAMGSVKFRSEVKAEFREVSARYRERVSRLLQALGPPAEPRPKAEPGGSHAAGAGRYGAGRGAGAGKRDAGEAAGSADKRSVGGAADGAGKRGVDGAAGGADKRSVGGAVDGAGERDVDGAAGGADRSGVGGAADGAGKRGVDGAAGGADKRSVGGAADGAGERDVDGAAGGADRSGVGGAASRIRAAEGNEAASWLVADDAGRAAADGAEAAAAPRPRGVRESGQSKRKRG